MGPRLASESPNKVERWVQEGTGARSASRSAGLERQDLNGRTCRRQITNLSLLPARLGGANRLLASDLLLRRLRHDVRIYGRSILKRLWSADMGEIVRFVPKADLERARLIREARAIYESIFPQADTISEPRDQKP
jgi:hypothetical protein